MSELSRVSTDQKLVEMWLHGRPISTQNEYRRDVQAFFDFVDKCLQVCTLEDLQAYSTHLDTLDIKNTTKRRKLNAIKSLWSFATKLNYTRFNVAAALKIPKGQQSLAGRILKQTEVLKLVERGAKPGRDRALLKLMYATGMRVSEICSLKWGDFHERDSGEVQVTVLGKGEKLRTVLVPPVVWLEVESLRGAAGDDEPVFISCRGKALERTMVHRIIKEAAATAGVNEKVSCHWLRHAHAVVSLEKGAPIHLVRDSLGHSNISTTNVYLESNPTDCSSKYLGL
ncbi:tyrosine-type recombinase/integrase [Pelatocladus sp. BLCC-F211]|uniref:tyrosine-type recombinase/integrase n=1 Tax=Pelatocladus sp. BLCC-F211 TaxID=3342752 RepID=UPI0035B8697B